MHENYERFLEDENDCVKPLSAKFQDEQKQAKELVFIQSIGNVIVILFL